MRHVLIALMVVLAPVMAPAAASAEDRWNGVWFECEFAGRTNPPADQCAMLDDDGFIFSEGSVTYVKVTDSMEEADCKKQRKGQCFRADAPAISVDVLRQGKAEFTETTLGINFMFCTQIFHTTDMGDFIEARPDDNRCYWAGEKRFYLRRYQGEMNKNG